MRKLHWILNRYMAPAGDAGSDTGGTEVLDRGDDFTPDEDGEEEDKADNTDKKESSDGKDGRKEPPEDEPGEDDEDKAGKTRKDSRIPLSRHKEILEKERGQRAELEKQLETYRKGQAVATTNEEITKREDKLLELEKAYTKHLADGELDKATATMKDIRTTERGIIEGKAELATRAAEARAYERVRYDTVVERLEAAYSALNEDHEDYDGERVKEVLELKEAYQLKGYAPADALQKAAKILLGAETSRQKTATTADVRVDKEDLAKATAAERKKAQVDKNVSAAGKTPPSAARVGLDSDKAGGSLTQKDIVKMPYAEFSKLDEAQLAKLRGDDFAG